MAIGLLLREVLEKLVQGDALGGHAELQELHGCIGANALCTEEALDLVCDRFAHALLGFDRIPLLDVRGRVAANAMPTVAECLDEPDSRRGLGSAFGFLIPYISDIFCVFMREPKLWYVFPPERPAGIQLFLPLELQHLCLKTRVFRLKMNGSAQGENIPRLGSKYRDPI